MGEGATSTAQPFKCPSCPSKHYYGVLKLRGTRPLPCPNCSTPLIATGTKVR